MRGPKLIHDPNCGLFDIASDTCDDASVGVDDFGPLPDADPANDGTDTDGDGQCDAGDPDDDNDGVLDADDPAVNQVELLKPTTPRVRTRLSQAESFVTQTVSSGRTEAKRSVEVKAETSGRVVFLPVEKGAVVDVGDHEGILKLSKGQG